MYDFLLSEVWWMETIITAIITSITTIIVAYIGYNSKIKEKIQRIVENTNSISKLHSHRHKEHDSLFKENCEIKSTCSSVKDVVDKNEVTLNKIKEQVVAENARQKLRYNYLTEHQQNMINGVENGVDSFNAIREELIKMNERNISLKNEIGELKNNLEWKGKRINEFRSERTLLQKENKDLYNQLTNLQNRYNDLSSKYIEINNKTKINRTNEFYIEP